MFGGMLGVQEEEFIGKPEKAPPSDPPSGANGRAETHFLPMPGPLAQVPHSCIKMGVNAFPLTALLLGAKKREISKAPWLTVGMQES